MESLMLRVFSSSMVLFSSIEMVNLSTDKLNNLWATLGAKYMPSVLYQLRLLTFDSIDLREYSPAIQQLRTTNNLTIRKPD
jgi:hypothetical protein